MTHDGFFLDTLDDFETRSQLGRGAYDALLMAAIRAEANAEATL